MAYFVILEFDSQPQINRHQQAHCRTYLVLVLLKIRLRLVFRLILISRRSQPINKAPDLWPNQKTRLLNLKTSLSILWILFLRMKFQLHLNRFLILKNASANQKHISSGHVGTFWKFGFRGSTMLETKCVGDKFEMLVTDSRCW